MNLVSLWRNMERITATYYIETPYAPEKAAQVLAGEQSSGTFVAVPGETEELKQRFAARVESVELIETVNRTCYSRCSQQGREISSCRDKGFMEH